MHGEDEETWRRGEERGGEGRKDGEEKRRRRKADWGSSIKAAADFHPSCGDTEGERWIKRCRDN